MHIFYTSEIQTGILDKEESHHCFKVLRLNSGDRIAIVDGKGTYAEAILETCNQKSTSYTIDIIQENYQIPGYFLHMAIAPTKNINRLEWFIEKATEIGVSEITPILCENSERKVLKNERLKKLIVSAAKQSKKALFPRLNAMVPFKDFVNLRSIKEIPDRMIAYCNDETLPFISNIAKHRNSLVCIGPEGDFSADEINKAKSAGFKGISLGKSRLRTETAGIYACSVLNMHHQM